MAKEIYNKNAREAHLMAEAYQRVYNEGQMHTFGNVQFEPLGKDANNAEAFRVYKDGNYVLYATMFGPRQTVTFYTDPKDQAGPDTPLAEFNLQQVPGGIEQAAAAIGAAEDAEGDWAKNTEAGKEDGNEPDNRNKGDTPWYDEKEAEDEQKELSHQDLIEWATQTGDGSLREEAYEALLAAYNEMERSKAALQAGQKPGGYYANM